MQCKPQKHYKHRDDPIRYDTIRYARAQGKHMQYKPQKHYKHRDDPIRYDTIRYARARAPARCRSVPRRSDVRDRQPTTMMHESSTTTDSNSHHSHDDHHHHQRQQQDADRHTTTTTTTNSSRADLNLAHPQQLQMERDTLFAILLQRQEDIIALAGQLRFAAHHRAMPAAAGLGQTAHIAQLYRASYPHALQLPPTPHDPPSEQDTEFYNNIMQLAMQVRETERLLVEAGWLAAPQTPAARGASAAAAASAGDDQTRQNGDQANEQKANGGAAADANRRHDAASPERLQTVQNEQLAAFHHARLGHLRHGAAHRRAHHHRHGQGRRRRVFRIGSSEFPIQGRTARGRFHFDVFNIFPWMGYVVQVMFTLFFLDHIVPMKECNFAFWVWLLTNAGIKLTLVFSRVKLAYLVDVRPGRQIDIETDEQYLPWWRFGNHVEQWDFLWVFLGYILVWGQVSQCKEDYAETYRLAWWIILVDSIYIMRKVIFIGVGLVLCTPWIAVALARNEMRRRRRRALGAGGSAAQPRHIDALPRITFQQGMFSSPPSSHGSIADDIEVGSAGVVESDHAQCAICISDYEAGDQLIALPCHWQHHFHTECITDWLRQRASCPVCRAPVFDDRGVPRPPMALARPISEDDGADSEMNGGGDGGSNYGNGAVELTHEVLSPSSLRDNIHAPLIPASGPSI